MDTLLQVCTNSLDGFKFDSCSNKKLVNGCRPSILTEAEILGASPGYHPESSKTQVDSPPYSDSYHPDNSVILKYINEILMEDDLEGQTCMLQDCLALQAAEKSFYEVLNHKDPPSMEQKVPYFNQFDDYPDDNFTRIIRKESNFSNSLTNLPESSNLFPVLNESRARKSHFRDETDDGRSNKHAALSLPDMEQPDMFDEVLLCHNEDVEAEPLGQIIGRSKESRRSKRHGNKAEVVDLSTLLTQCAQAVASFDKKTAADLLRQIRQHASQSGDGMQRMAFYFANALEARLVGTQTPAYTPLVSNRTSLTDLLEAYKVFITACPFRRMSHVLANRTIRKIAAQAKKIHIVDFGILYGFQWPCLIQRLSSRPGGPPALRITGIELPQPGFRPTERVEETGRRLRRYCERFGVPFEYNFIAKKWETIQLEDLKIDKEETTIVNSLYRFKHIPDETVNVNSARDAVLNLIRQIKPDLFVQGVVNGTYNAPFFLTRFREALFHFSALFDVFEATVPREYEQRMLFERELLARDVINVVACEGTERVERPETYKQWQVRNMRAGFKQVGLDQEVLKKVRSIVRSHFHKDFVIDVDGQWMLQGWKGRVLFALSCWKPV